MNITNMIRHAIKWVPAAGSLASLILFIDTYFLNASIADAFLIPVSIPTGVFALILALLMFFLFLATRRIKTDHETTVIENPVNIELQNELAQSKWDFRALENTLGEYTSLENKIIALLLPTTYGLSIHGIKNGLSSNVTTDDILAAIAVLEGKGKVTQGKLDSYYMLNK